MKRTGVGKNLNHGLYSDGTSDLLFFVLFCFGGGEAYPIRASMFQCIIDTVNNSRRHFTCEVCSLENMVKNCNNAT